MKAYKVTISYTVTEEAFVEAESAEQAEELVRKGAVDCEWYTISTGEWECLDVEEESYF